MAGCRYGGWLRTLRRMVLYETVDFERDKYVEAYKRHHDDVRRYFRKRPSDLLEINIIEGEGWEKLCPFLGLPIPDMSFPRSNTRSDWIRSQGRSPAMLRGVDTRFAYIDTRRINREETKAQSEETMNLIAPHGDAPSVHPDRLVYSCLMDNKPKYIHQTFVLLWTLLDLARVPPEQIVLHAIEGCDEAVLSALRKLGVRLRMVLPFVEGYPNCNKLQQLASPELLEAEVAILLDTDTAVLQDISRAASSRNVRARAVGGPYPPLLILKEIFREAGFDDTPVVAQTSFGAHPTFRVNCNGGVYFLPRHALAALETEWPKRARWLIDHIKLLPKNVHFALDQVSFALACHALGLDIDLLPLEMNYQIRATKPNQNISPIVLHYHSHVDPSGLLRAIDKPKVDAAVHQVNNVIRRRRREPVNTKLFGHYHDISTPPVDSGESEETSSDQPLPTAPERRFETPYGVFFSYQGDMITKQLEDFGAHTRNELAMLLSFVRKGDVIIDVGAHIGTFAVPLARAAGKEGKVIAVEPEASALALLRKNVTVNGLDTRIDIVESLVSDGPKAFRPIIDPSNTAATYFVEDGTGSTVPVFSLDTV